MLILDTNFEELESIKIQVPEPLAIIVDRLSEYCDDKTLQKKNCGDCPFLITNPNPSETACYVVNQGYSIPAYWGVYEEDEEGDINA